MKPTLEERLREKIDFAKPVFEYEYEISRSIVPNVFINACAEIVKEEARIEAMYFAYWMMDKHYYNTVTNSRGVYFYKGYQSPEKRELLTIEQLYELFKQETYGG